ncbi:enoyl-CoA hydratase/isomerase family protein [Ornithinibacillus xuwenensis]|uniref:Enoyl-CoA hydratase/isomerase family protein n=1 Tax=Ornithinibacillus xuwenensis TaxID=3144668 RepID=A0ABU9XE46_9BACI
MTETVIYERITEKEYGIITLNRPNKRNAISLAMAEELMQCIQFAKKDKIKFLVVTGAGERTFCAGGDLNEMHGNLSEHEAFDSLIKMMQVLYELATIPIPTIALLNGSAVGGGCELATACDIRIAKNNTKYGFVQTNLGIIPGWGGGVLLARRVHHSFSNQWIMEGSLYEAEALREKGWIHRIVEESEWEDTDKLLKPYLTKSFKQMEILKELFLDTIGVIGLEDKMKREVQKCASLWESEAHKKAVTDFHNRS